MQNKKFTSLDIEDHIKQEIKALLSLSHENIIKIEETMKTPEKTSLVLEYCNGGTLLDFCRFYKKNISIIKFL